MKISQAPKPSGGRDGLAPPTSNDGGRTAAPGSGLPLLTIAVGTIARAVLSA